MAGRKRFGSPAAERWSTDAEAIAALVARCNEIGLLFMERLHAANGPAWNSVRSASAALKEREQVGASHVLASEVGIRGPLLDRRIGASLRELLALESAHDVELESGSVECRVDGEVHRQLQGRLCQPAANESACQSNSPPGCELHYGASVYHNVTAGYNIEPLNTRIDVGVDNLSDKQPAIIYQNNTLNGNVDANTFDTIGRFYRARVTVKF